MLGARGVEDGRLLAEGRTQPGAFGAAARTGGEQHAAPVGVGDLLGAQGPVPVVEEARRFFQELQPSAQPRVLFGPSGMWERNARTTWSRVKSVISCPAGSRRR
jgi:hypothetical protein